MFTEDIQFDIINDLHKFELLNKSISNKDTNKIPMYGGIKGGLRYSPIGVQIKGVS